MTISTLPSVLLQRVPCLLCEYQRASDDTKEVFLIPDNSNRDLERMYNRYTSFKNQYQSSERKYAALPAFLPKPRDHILLIVQKIAVKASMRELYRDKILTRKALEKYARNYVYAVYMHNKGNLVLKKMGSQYTLADRLKVNDIHTKLRSYKISHFSFEIVDIVNKSPSF